MVKHKVTFSNILDNLVVATVLPILLFFMFCFIFSFINPKMLSLLMGIYDTLFPKVIAVCICVVLGLWIFIGNGVKSKLWDWLPPFVFFRSTEIYIRRRFVLIVILGTFIGLFGAIFGLVDPRF